MYCRFAVRSWDFFVWLVWFGLLVLCMKNVFPSIWEAFSLGPVLGCHVMCVVSAPWPCRSSRWFEWDCPHRTVCLNTRPVGSALWGSSGVVLEAHVSGGGLWDFRDSCTCSLPLCFVRMVKDVNSECPVPTCACCLLQLSAPWQLLPLAQSAQMDPFLL